MIVTKRGVNTKRHTTHYLVGGKWRTRAETVRLAQRGKVENAVVRRGGNDEMHIAARPYTYPRMYDLPVLTQAQIRRNCR